VEPTWRNPHDGVVVATDANRPADNRGIGAEAPPPQGFGEHERVASGAIVRGRQQPSRHGLRALDVEVVARHELAPDLRRRVAAERVRDAHERRNLDVAAQPIASGDVVGIRKRLKLRRRRSAVVERDELVAAHHVRRAPERLIDNAHRERRDGDRHAKRHNGYRSRSLPLREKSPGNLDVLQHSVVTELSAVALAKAGRTPELPAIQNGPTTQSRTSQVPLSQWRGW
jgi:hypothetical protein